MAARHDIAIADGRIAAVGPALPVRGAREIDAGGDLVVAALRRPHFHMDATLRYGLPRVNASGTLLEGIALWGELKPQLTQEALVERALHYCDWRSRTACWRSAATSTSATTACWRSRRCSTSSARWRPISICSWSPSRRTAISAQPERGRATSSAPSTWASTWSAASRISSARWPTAPPRCGAVRARRRRGLRVDMHCDETDDPLSRHIETLAYEASGSACTAA